MVTEGDRALVAVISPTRWTFWVSVPVHSCPLHRYRSAMAGPSWDTWSGWWRHEGGEELA